MNFHYICAIPLPPKISVSIFSKCYRNETKEIWRPFRETCFSTIVAAALSKALPWLLAAEQQLPCLTTEMKQVS